MGVASGLFSLLLHIALVLISIHAPWQGGEIRLDLDKPVYEVELVRMPEQKKAVQVPRTTQEQGQKKASKQAKVVPKQTKPAAAKTPQAKPVQIAQQRKKAPPTKVPQKKEAPPKEPPEPKSRQEVKTPEAELQEALQDVTAQAEQEAASDEEILAQELASLSREQAAQGVDVDNLGRSASAQMTRRLYGNIIRERIRTNWRFPDLGADEDLQAEVRIQINDQGVIVDHSLERASGNPQFDDSVLRAIARTGSLPVPEKLDERTFEVIFHLQELRP